MPLLVSHLTRYTFETQPSRGLFQIRKRPRTLPGQTVLTWELSITGGRLEAEFFDHNGNAVALASLASGAHEIAVQAQGAVDVVDRAGVSGPLPECAPLWLYRRQTARTFPGPAIMRLVAQLPQSGGADLAKLHALCAAVHAGIRYDPGRTTVGTLGEEAARAGHGVCQDHAHVFCGAARALGFPARYVSGYLLLQGGVTAEASHAWAEAWIEGLGWVGFDPANAICPDWRYVRVAQGLDYAEAAPINGLAFGETGAIAVEVAVEQQQQ